MKKTLLLFVFSIFIKFIFAQEIAVIPNYTDTILEAYKLSLSEQYTEALKRYNSVPENDTTYVIVAAERMKIYNHLGKFAEAVQVGEYVFNNWKRYLNSDFIINYGAALEKNGNTEKAIKIYNYGLKKYPMNYKIYFNKAIVLEKEEKYQEAFEIFKKVVEINPFFALGHYKLGAYALNEKKISLGILSYNAYLLLNPDTKNSNAVFRELNEVGSDKIDDKVHSKGVDVCPGEDYSEIDLLVSNYVALNKKFKTDSKLTFPAIKQSYLVFTKFSEIKSNDQFWYRTYVPLFNEILKSNLFELYSYYISQTIDNKEVHKINLKYKDRYLSIGKKLFSINDDTHRQYYLNPDFKTVYRANPGFAVSLLCNLSPDKQKLQGKYYEFFEAGNIKAIGQYNREDEKNGDWFIYKKNGRISEKDYFKNNVLEDTVIVYSEFGVMTAKYSVKEGKLDGKIFKYNSSGAKVREMSIINDKLNGERDDYFDNGNISDRYSYKDGKINGRYVSFYPDGSNYEILHYNDDVKNGWDSVFYNNGQLMFIGNITDDKYNGKLIYYWENGNVKQEYTVVDDISTGEQKEYTKDGKLSVIKEFDEKGKLNGIRKEFYPDGKLFLEYNYKKGDIISYTFYDKKGNVIDTKERKQGKFIYTGYSENGLIQSTGEYKKGENNGHWKYYNEYGVLSSEVDYNEGKAEGYATFFYPNGFMYQKELKKDDKTSGLLISYSPYKIPYYKGYYDDDLKTATHISYYADGKVQSKSYYIKDKLNGYMYEYDPEGILYKKTFFENGIIKKLFYYNASDKLSDTISFNNGSGHVLLHNENGDVIFDYFMKNNQIEGDYKEYFSDKKLKVKSSYLNGELQGKYERYYINGQLETYFYFENGVRSGETKDFYENGKIKFESNYFENKLDGKYTRYFDDGNKNSEGNIVNGDWEGKTIYYSPDGNINHIRLYENNAINSFSYLKKGKELNIDFNGTGEVKLFYDNGKPSYTANLKNGWYEGNYVMYFPSGKKYIQNTYKYNEPVGESLKFYENGNIRKKSNYKYGEKYGKETEYYSNGKIKTEKNYVNGYLQGEYIEYGKSCEVLHKYVFRYDDLIKKIK